MYLQLLLLYDLKFISIALVEKLRGYERKCVLKGVVKYFKGFLRRCKDSQSGSLLISC